MHAGTFRPRATLAGSLLALASLAVSLGAQEPSTSTPAAVAPRSGAFGIIHLELTQMRNVNHERIHDFWDPGGGVAIELGTRLPVGTASVGFARLPFHARAADQPDFAARMLSLRWGVAHRIAGPLAVGGSLVAGNFLMRFDDGDRAVHGLVTESEMFVGGRGSLDVALTHWLSATVAASYERVLTRVPIGLVTVRAGARATANTPRWLRRVLE